MFLGLNARQSFLKLQQGFMVGPGGRLADCLATDQSSLLSTNNIPATDFPFLGLDYKSIHVRAIQSSKISHTDYIIR